MSTENREFKPVLENTSGTIEFISAKKLLESNKLGVIVEGTFQEALENNFESTKSDYKIVTDEGNTIVLNHSGSLAYQMSKVQLGSYVRISYEGQTPMKKGAMKGKLAHQFLVEVA